jgi:CopG family transcriptional regulator/antitoxin EndoAI
MPRKSEVMSISVPPELARDVAALATAERRSRSELVREALRQYVLMSRWHRLRRTASLQAVRLGLGPGDVERLVDEARGARRP